MERDIMLCNANEARGNAIQVCSSNTDLQSLCTHELKFLINNINLGDPQFSEFVTTVSETNYIILNDDEFMVSLLDFINSFLDVSNCEALLCSSVKMLSLMFDLYPSFQKIIFHIIEDINDGEEESNIFNNIIRLFTYPSEELQKITSNLFLSLSASGERCNAILNLAEMFLPQACIWTIEGIFDITKLNSLGFIGNVIISQCPLDDASLDFIFSKIETLICDLNLEIRNLSCWVISNILEYYDVSDVKSISVGIADLFSRFFGTFEERIPHLTNGEASLSNALLNPSLSPCADFQAIDIELIFQAIQEAKSEKVVEYMLKILVRYLDLNQELSQESIQAILDLLLRSFELNLKCQRLSVLAIGNILKHADLDTRFFILSNDIISNCFECIVDNPDNKCITFLEYFVESFEMIKISSRWDSLILIYENSGLDSIIQELIEEDQDDYLELCERLSAILST